MSEIKGIFREWEIDEFYVKHPERGYRLWIGIGPNYFRDANAGDHPFLYGASYWLRRRLWRELKRERRCRAENRIKELAASPPSQDNTPETTSTGRGGRR